MHHFDQNDSKGIFLINIFSFEMGIHQRLVDGWMDGRTETDRWIFKSFLKIVLTSNFAMVV